MKRATLVPLAAIVAVAAGCGSSSKPSTLPPSLRSARAYLAKTYLTRLRPLAQSTTVSVSMSAAERIAFRHSGLAPLPGAGVGLASVTGHCLFEHGKCRFLIRNRAMWIVLVPGQKIPFPVPYGYKGKGYYVATIAAMIDAHTGRYVQGLPLS